MNKTPDTDRRSVLVTGLELHRDAARFFVELASALDQPEPAMVYVGDRPIVGLDARQNASLAAVLNSHSAVEALINEIYFCQEKNFFMVFRGIDKDFAAKLDTARRAGVDRLGIRERADLAVLIKGAEPISWDRGFSQDLIHLNQLRNELVHHKARWIDDSREGPDSEDDIERRLHKKFPLAKLDGGGIAPFRWMKCLGAGCARWSWDTARGFINDISMRLQLGVAPLNF
jgi:hypothetical protein